MKAGATIALIILCTMPLFAKQSGKRGESSKVEQELNLTKEQEAQLSTAKAAHREKTRVARNDMQALKAQLNLELQKSTPDQKIIDDIAGKIAVVTQKIMLLQAAHLQELRTILNEEQYQKLLKMMNKKQINK